MTRVAACVHLNRLRQPTGVGKHILRMVEGLANNSGIESLLFASRSQIKDFPPGEFWSAIDTVSFPLPFGVMQRLWVALNWPAAEMWCGDLDWIYCPAESYVPCRRAKLAVTGHDVYAFETNLPWSGSLAHRKFRLKWKILFQRILANAHQLLAVSEFTKRRLIELLGAKEESITVIGNGVDDLFFEQSQPPADPRFTLGNYAVVLGGLSLRKGGDIVLKVAEKMEHQMPDIKVIVAGNSEAALAQEAARRKNIVQIGYTDDGQVHQLLSHSICLLFPSRYEGFGIPAVEAMASGTPVVVSNCSAIPEVVDDAGIFADDCESFIAAIRTLHEDGRLRREYVARGRARAERFRWQTCINRLSLKLAA